MLDRNLLNQSLQVANSATALNNIVKNIAAIKADPAAFAVLTESIPELQAAVTLLVAAATPAN